MESNSQTAAPPDSSPPLSSSSQPPSSTSAPAQKQSRPWASILAKMRAISIYHLTLALLLMAAIAAWLAISPASQLPAVINLVIASIVCVGAEAVLGWWAGPAGIWPPKQQQAAISAGEQQVSSAPKRAWRLSQTSLICGIIIGSILVPETSPLLVAVIALLAVVIKRLLHEGPFPFFNPAAAALVLGGIAFGTLDVWWVSASSGPGLFILIAAILLLSWKQNRWRMELAFLAAWLAGWAIFQHLPPLSNPASWSALLDVLPLYLMAFMLLEPKTSPVRPKQQYAYGAVAALATVFLLSFSSITDMILVGLLVGNLAKKIMEKLKLAI